MLHGYQRDRTDATDPNDRATEVGFFQEVDRRFRFTVDVAASPDNTKCERFYTVEDDGLAQPWGGESVWCNPPYSSIGPWVAKAWAEYRHTAAIVMLLPADRTEQVWWQQMVEPYRDRAGSPLRVEFLAGRLRFLKPGRLHIRPGERPPFGCCLLIWRLPEPDQPMFVLNTPTGEADAHQQ